MFNKHLLNQSGCLKTTNGIQSVATSWSCVAFKGGSASERSLVILSAMIAGSESCSYTATKTKINYSLHYYVYIYVL